eukprot:3411115-Rhodomonas_salina.4
MLVGLGLHSQSELKHDLWALDLAENRWACVLGDAASSAADACPTSVELQPQVCLPSSCVRHCRMRDGPARLMLRASCVCDGCVPGTAAAGVCERGQQRPELLCLRRVHASRALLLSGLRRAARTECVRASLVGAAAGGREQDVGAEPDHHGLAPSIAGSAPTTACPEPAAHFF